MDKEIIECPYCEEFCEADWVDVGVGLVQCGPYHCDFCGASQIGPYDEKRELTDIEKKTNWYAPNSIPGSSANVINGKVVSAEIMRANYQKHFQDNPLYYDKTYVKNWYEEIRKK